MSKPLSAAFKRVLAYDKGPEWFCEFKVTDLLGDFAYVSNIFLFNDLVNCKIRNLA